MDKSVTKLSSVTLKCVHKIVSTTNIDMLVPPITGYSMFPSMRIHCFALQMGIRKFCVQRDTRLISSKLTGFAV